MHRVMRTNQNQIVQVVSQGSFQTPTVAATLAQPKLIIMNHTLTDRTWILLKASRFLAWTFGPLLFSVGMVHSRGIPKLKSFGLLRAILQIFALSVPLCISMHDNHNYLPYFTYNYLTC
jgi:hypothetical protein